MNRTAWWKRSVVYQIYPRSFCDSNGDGIGDLAGITSKLDYLKALGVDVVWLSPVYRSPNDDNGYDISDYRAIMEEFGTLADFDTMLAGMHARGIKLVMDLVVNHTSDEHRWFQEAKKSRDNRYHDYYLWREPKADGSQGSAGPPQASLPPSGGGLGAAQPWGRTPPTNWEAAFSGSAWQWNEATGEYYLHMFSPKQPDLNWENPKVRAEVYELMRFWLDRGVDGFRMDVINMISKPWNADGSLPDAPVVREGFLQPGFALTCNGPRLLEFLREMRREVLDHYDTLTVGEAPMATTRQGREITNEETGALDMLFQFEHMDLDSVPGHGNGKWALKPLDLRDLKSTMARWQRELEGQGWNSLYLNNHDQPRPVSRFGDDGEHRVRSAKMLATWLHLHQGTPFIYQGEELGMPNARFERVEDLRDIESINHFRVATQERGQDPATVMASIQAKGRDNARTPMPWSAGPHAGFTTGTPWIALNPTWREINAEAALADADSVFHHYQRLIALRRSEPLLVTGRFEPLWEGHTELAVFLRHEGERALLVLCNFSDAPAHFALPDDIAFRTQELVIGNLPQDASAAGANLRDLTLAPWEARVVHLGGFMRWQGPDAQATRLWRRMADELGAHPQWPGIDARVRAHVADLRNELAQLYGQREDFEAVVGRILRTAFDAWCERSDDLSAHDAARAADPQWFQSQRMLGAVCYADLWAGDLKGVEAQIPYFKELGLTYLHLMPPFLCPDPHNDGGYAVSSYRAVAPHLGRMDDLRRLAASLREAGISLVLDFVFNHTSDEHEWARAAKAGQAPWRDYYLIYPDRSQPDAYERTTREIFPDEHPGAFSQLEDGRWVWTTFHSYQWDLNYANPEVFAAMAGEMLYIANLGVEFLRMDAVAFVWKRLGTPCENLPEAHALLRAYNALARIAAPSLLFKSEAIVHPDDVVKYISPGECQVSYNPLQMALLWNSLATREVNLLQMALAERHGLPEGTAWVNYVRSHDDIGWTFADEDAARIGIDGFDHRQFLNRYFVNRFPGSFARGVPFQDNPQTGDCRISGTCASLCGLEQGDPHAAARILLLYGVVLSSGGIPLIYLGDEVGTLNDPRYVDDPGKESDSRWVHRPKRDTQRYAQRKDANTSAGQIYTGLARLVAARRQTDCLAGGHLVNFDTRNKAVLGFQRPSPRGPVLVLANFSEFEQAVSAEVLSAMPAHAVDLVGGFEHRLAGGLKLGPYQQLWLDCRA